MPENTRAENHRTTVKVPEFLREPIELAQARLEAFEEEAQKVVKDLIHKSKASRKDFTVFMQRLSKQDWGMEDLKDGFQKLRVQGEKLRVQGKERAQELAGKADSFRADALERLEELQSRAIRFLGVASREQVEYLARELDKLAKRLGKGEKARPRKSGKRAAAEV